MKHARSAFLPKGALFDRITRVAVGLVVVPLFVFAWWVFLQSPSRLANLTPVVAVDVWHEALGPVVFSNERLESIVKSPPDWAAIRWEPSELPNVKELGVSVDLPPTAQKKRVWFRIRVPKQKDGRGRLGLLDNRVIAHGPWAIWVDRELVQTNLGDWNIQLNVPLRVTVPPGSSEVLLAVPYVEPMGYAVGSMFFGPIDEVDSAWAERNVWHMEASRFMAVAALLLMVASFHLALSRPREPIFWVLGLNAMAWSVSCLQFVFGTSDQNFGVWFDFAVDTSTTWSVILAVIFALEFEDAPVPGLRAGLALYAIVSTILVMPLWQWERSALLGYHYFNVAAMVIGLAVLTWQVIRRPRREGWVMLVALVTILGMSMYTLGTITNYAQPDEIFLYPIGIVVLYITFSYAMNRRTIAALNEAEAHEMTLSQRLEDQEKMLTAQHHRLHQLETERNLASLRESIMQDLHDRVGSNLTTALVQARSGKMTGNEALLVLQELAIEVRHLAKNEASGARQLSLLLSEMRQRFDKRLRHAVIELEWHVDPDLHRANVQTDEGHLRSILGEAIANVIKHAGATRIVIRASMTSQGSAQISVQDNGVGFTKCAVIEGRGLPGMRSRAEAIGAMLEISEMDDGGTLVALTIPVTVTVTVAMAVQGGLRPM